MKLLLSTFILITISVISFAQEIKKEQLVGIWKTCGTLDDDIDKEELSFQHPTPECRDNNCGEHTWIFRAHGSVEFVFTQGCDTGFNSKTKRPKRWIFSPSTNILKLITQDGFKEYFEVISVDEKLVLKHRFDLE